MPSLIESLCSIKFTSQIFVSKCMTPYFSMDYSIYYIVHHTSLAWFAHRHQDCNHVVNCDTRCELQYTLWIAIHVVNCDITQHKPGDW